MYKNNRLLLSLGVAALTAVNLASVACSPLSGMPAVEITTKETSLSQIDPLHWMAESYRISPDNRIFAFGNNVDNQKLIVVNGKEDKRYDEVVPSYLIYSPDSKHIAYAASNGAQHYLVIDGKENGPYDEILYSRLLQFSPDSKRLAYAVKRGESTYVVIDGKENGPYEDFAYGVNSRFFNDPIFSRDSLHYAYAAKSGGKWFAVIDGEAGPEFNQVLGVTLSKTGKHNAYIATSDNISFMMIDGKVGKPYEQMSHAVFSPSEDAVAYVASSGKDHYVVANGNETTKFLDIGNVLMFSPDSKRLVFIAAREDGQYLIVNDEQAGPYAAIDPPVFSPDGSRFAFVADQGSSWVVVTDTREATPYPNVDPTSIVFSADNKRLGYVIQTQGENVKETVHTDEPTGAEEHADDRFAAVIDGKMEKEYKGIGQFSLVFSPDGQHYAYSAADEKDNVYIVFDGKEIGPYENTSATAPIFSSDSKLLIYTVMIKNKMYLVVNGKQGKPFDGIINQYGGNLIMDSANTLHYIAASDNKIYLVEETITIK